VDLCVSLKVPQGQLGGIEVILRLSVTSTKASGSHLRTDDLSLIPEITRSVRLQVVHAAIIAIIIQL